MAYEGNVLTQSGVISPDLRTVEAVAVSGSGPNVCGHLLLHAGGPAGGYYFHVATGDQFGGLWGYPKYMDADGFQRYLKENAKTVLRRVSVRLPKPEEGLNTLMLLMSQRWFWGVLPNNCVAFVEEVIKAGGGEWASYTNCPTIATAPTVTDRINDFFRQAEVEIYRAMGVPRF